MSISRGECHEVTVEDFDFSNNECSTGFHFFCSKEQAKNYNA